MEDTIYFNVPIQLISGLLIDKRIVINIISYACFDYCQKQNVKIDDALIYFDLEVHINQKELIFKKGKLLFNSLPFSSPMVGVNKMKLYEFLEKDKSDFDIACFLAFLAIKSILQNKTYCKIDNKYLLSRMDGKACSVKAISDLSEPIKKFANDYQLVKIKNALILNWGLKHYARYTRGFYVSFKMKLEDLIYQAELRRKSVKERELKRSNDEAYNLAMARLNKTRP